MTAPPQPRFDVVIVGAGPAGATAAYTLAKKGFKVIVIERGRTPGAKNLFGGRIYVSPLEEIYSGFRKEAPIERWVKRERISLTTGDGEFTVEYSSRESTSFISPLSSIANWMAKKAEEEGAVIITDIRVDEFLVEDGWVKGIKAGGDKLYSDVVVDAEGVNRLLLERSGLARKLSPNQVALGVKEVIKLDTKQINKRLGLDSDEGLAWYLIGSATNFLPGGAFLYTNSTSVSIGLVIFLEEAVKIITDHIFDLVERLRLSPALRKITGDGSLLEYGAHLTPELGLDMLPRKLYGNGFLVAGDAAGFLLNLGYTVRGVDLAAYSGYLAARAIDDAGGDYGEESLSSYLKLLRESFIFKEMKKHKRIRQLMNKDYLFSVYPEIAVDTAKRLFEFDERSPTILEALRESTKGKASLLRILLDMLNLVRGP